MTNELVERLAARFENPPEVSRSRALGIARACLSEIEAAGLVIVPKEPTQEMCDATPRYVPDTESAKTIWRDMIAAAPKP